MTKFNVLHSLANAKYDIPDPGAGGAFDVSKTGICKIETAAAEARSLADPIKEGIEKTFLMTTNGGNCTITVATAINQAGNTTITLDAVGEMITLRSMPDHASSGDYRWRVIDNDGATLS